ncbi:kinase-like protein [Calocera cornea HHB12733]|uniref:Kinase-like protein n=1 Tax=Calocera cornea HHB12733 TaxID=1353952 RepID=A0A165ER18_9BASI|nr:kinase-like protein [Calocera cornea HHB12733]
MDVVRAGPTAPRLPLLRDLTEGLMYLHTHKPSPIVHGDIRGGNVLIDVVEGRRVARLTDFGLAHVVESVEEQRTNSTTMMRAGNARWLAFERMMPEKYNLSNPRDAKSPKSDIFELMRTFYEVWIIASLPFLLLKALKVLIGQAPFHGLNDFAAIAAVQEKQNPERPGEDLAPELDAEMWRLMEQAWSVKRNARPRLSEILDYFDSRSDIRKMVSHTYPLSCQRF